MSSRSSFFLDKFGDMRKKKEFWEEKRRKQNKLRERGDIVSMNTDITLFIVRVLTTYYLLYLFIFII